MAQFLDYDTGFRHGTFDKCNGARPDFERDESCPWTCGYFDAYDANEIKIQNVPAWSDTEYDIAKADYLKRFRAIVGSFTRSLEQQDALENALEDVLDEVRGD